MRGERERGFGPLVFHHSKLLSLFSFSHPLVVLALQLPQLFDLFHWLRMSDAEEKRCPLCTEEMDLTDKQLKPCKCGYEICVWCWNHIMDMAEKEKTEGRCPACRIAYDKEKIVSSAASLGRLVAEINSGRKLKAQKPKPKSNEGRKHLSDVRVVQRHLAYIMGLPSILADEDVLGRKEYFGQYGKVLKVSLSRTSAGAIQFFPNDTCCVYITYSKEEEAVRCIQSVHGYTLDGKPLRACFGTTKYCHTWLRNMPCNNPDCLYLHDIGSQEDSFTKDEIVSAYTRVPQVAGTTNNLHRTSGSMLPPPVDDFSISGTASGKPIPRIPPSIPLSKSKSSPPDDSSGRSAALPAAASWGLRVSNGQPPNTSSTCLNGSTKQIPKGQNCSSGTTQTSTLHSDGRNKPMETGGHVLNNADRESESFGYSKKYIVKKFIPDTPEEVVRDAVPPTVTVGDSLSSSPTSNNDDSGIDMLKNVAYSVDCSRQPFVSASAKDDNVPVNKAVHSLCSGFSSLGLDSRLYTEHSDAAEHSDSFSGHPLYRPHTSQQTYTEHAREPLKMQSSRDDSYQDSREFSDWGSGSKMQVPNDASTAVAEELLAFGKQSSKVSESNFPSRSLYTSNSSISNHSVGLTWQNANVSGSSHLGSRDPRNVRTEVTETSFLTSSDSVLPNGYSNNRINSTGDLKNSNHSNFPNFERAKYMGRFHTDAANFDAVDMGESSIISNILSMDFDACDESLASHHNLADLLSDTDKQLNSYKTASSRKAHSSNQSRFSFARQEDYANEATDIGSSFYNTQHETNRRSALQDSRENHDMYLDEFQTGYSSRLDSHTFSNGNLNISNGLSGLRAQVSAPPGFSGHNKPPPPGFSPQQRMDLASDVTSGNQLLRNSSLLKNQYHVRPAANLGNFEDSEFIDPAIMAVGRGTHTNGITNLGIDTRSNFSSQLGASESDLRLQLLMQQSILGQQSLNYSDNMFSPLVDAYNTPSKHIEQSPFSQLHTQSRNAHIQNGWEGWNEVQSGNDRGVAEIIGNDRLGYNSYYPGYENLKYQMQNSGRLYNRAFGM